MGVTLPGGIGDDKPAVFVGSLGRRCHRVVVVAIDPHNPGAEAFHGGLAPFTHLGMDVDNARTSEQTGSPGHRTAVVAVRGGDHSDLPNLLGILSGANSGEGDL